MITCKKCGAQLDINTARCPYCGAINEEALEHLNKLHKFEKDYQKTKNDVYTKIKTYSKGYSYLITLVILLISLFILLMITADSYSINNMLAKRDYQNNKEVIHQKLDELLDEEDYESYAIYFKNIGNGAYIEELREYRKVANLSEYLMDIKLNILNYLENSLSLKYTNPISRASGDIVSFYSDYNHYKTNEDVQNVKNELEEFLKTNLNFNDEDLNFISKATSTNINALIHERINKLYETKNS